MGEYDRPILEIVVEEVKQEANHRRQGYGVEFETRALFPRRRQECAFSKWRVCVWTLEPRGGLRPV